MKVNIRYNKNYLAPPPSHQQSALSYNDSASSQELSAEELDNAQHDFVSEILYDDHIDSDAHNCLLDHENTRENVNMRDILKLLYILVSATTVDYGQKSSSQMKRWISFQGNEGYELCKLASSVSK